MSNPKHLKARNHHLILSRATFLYHGFHIHTAIKTLTTPPPASTTVTKTITSLFCVHRSHSTMASPSTNPNNSAAAGMKPAPEDEYLSNCTHLSRQQILRRRSYHMKQLAKCYRDHYWGLMEELRVRYREYVWKFGMNPFQEERNEEEKVNVKVEQATDGIEERIGAAGNGNGGNNSLLCAFHGCKMKAMTLTNFCQLHILSDPKQQLYKPCDYVIKSAQTGPITCGKPILRSIVPCLCNIHFQKAQQHVSRALKKAGLNIGNTNKVVPKFHVVVTEYIRIIQDRRKNASRANRKKIMPKLEIDS